MEKLNTFFFYVLKSSSESKETAVDALKNIGKSADNIIKQFGKGFSGTIHMIYIFHLSLKNSYIILFIPNTG